MLSFNRYFLQFLRFPSIFGIGLNLYVHFMHNEHIFTALNHAAAEKTRIYEYLKIFSVFLQFVIKTPHFCVSVCVALSR